MVSGVCGENEEPRSRPRGRNLSHSLHSWRRCLDSSPVQCSREAIAGRMPVQTLNGTNRHRQTVRTRSQFRYFFPSIARTATMSPPKHARYQRGSVAREEGNPNARGAAVAWGVSRRADGVRGTTLASEANVSARATARARSLRAFRPARGTRRRRGRPDPSGCCARLGRRGRIVWENQRNGRSDVGHVQGELPASSQGSRR